MRSRSAGSSSARQLASPLQSLFARRDLAGVTVLLDLREYVGQPWARPPAELARQLVAADQRLPRLPIEGVAEHLGRQFEVRGDGGLGVAAARRQPVGD